LGRSSIPLSVRSLDRCFPHVVGPISIWTLNRPHWIQKQSHWEPEVPLPFHFPAG
jgi:hypothetical protein